MIAIVDGEAPSIQTMGIIGGDNRSLDGDSTVM